MVNFFSNSPGDFPPGVGAVPAGYRNAAKAMEKAAKPSSVSQSSQPTGVQNPQHVYVSDTGTHDVEFAVVHNLGYVPGTATFGVPSKLGTLYRGTTAWTTDTAYFKFAVADNAALSIFFV